MVKKKDTKRKKKYELTIGNKNYNNMVDYAEAELEKERALGAVSGIKERIKLIRKNEQIIKSLQKCNLALNKQLERFRKGKTTEKEVNENIEEFLSRYETEDWGEIITKLEEKLEK